MLVLTRKKSEKIIIDDNIEITVVEIEGNKVKVGIDAPKSIEIHREEVYRRIEEENKEAASSKDLSRIGSLVIKKEEKDSK